ncbi:glycosyl hydrolase [Puia dinghuensis]|uniref:RNA polymerase n=1 Tax=Puia dinghuensis TaxID=1792502 RepID=A0A8J2XQ30_9BACT|nr:glycosyl hydrolase [Puia dinghuensis]GGA81410.1 RNA polymerase [Puia dinghuensis]
MVFTLVLGSCKKNSSSSNSGNGDSTKTATNSKKGADFNVGTLYGSYEGNVVNLKAFWYYTWGTLVPVPTPQNCDFVSMFWGQGNMTASNIAAVQQAKAQGQVKYILGFNEPDRPDQSNMTVSQALAYWPQLESIGLPLGSPATSWPTNQWFSDFMDSVSAEKLRVDFICVHMYVGTDDNSFVQTLQTVYNKYHLPIWITEFATADWKASTPAANQYTPADALGFMQRLLPKLDSLSYVQRYSWFSGDPGSAALWPSALINTNGQLTTLGAWYANYQPNGAIKP